MDRPARILHLEDDTADAELIRATLETANIACRITVVQTRDQFSEALREGGFDVILADYTLPSYDGLSAMRLAQELCPDIPFIFVSGTMGEDPAIEALTKGATDYVLKQKLSRIGPAVRRALREAENRKERKRMETVLCESEERFRTLAEKSPVGVYIIQDDLFRYVNAAFADILGYLPDEIINTFGPETFLTDEDRERVLEEMRRRLAGEIVLAHHEFHVRRKDGVIRTVEIYGSRALHQGRPAVLGTLIDVTERQELEKKFRQAQKMEAIGTLAGGIAHDFNNILGVIIGFTELSLINMEAASENHGYLAEVLKAGDRAKNLVKQILTFSRKRETERKAVQVEIIVKEALKMLRAALPTTIEIRQDISQDPANVFADPTQIHQILMNLCTNAAHAMREKGGILEVALSNLNLDTETARAHAGLNPGPYVELRVADTGHGMDQAVMERIFDPYFTTKDPGEGTGLGLAVVHGIVQDYGGTVTVRSKAGKGATFQVLIPRIDSFNHTQVFEPVISNLPSGKERILFVDDEEALVRIGKEMLARLGYEVVTRTSSFEALEAFRAQPHRFDLVITDMAMPNMSGWDLTQNIMKIRADIPVILCTGFSEMINSERARSIGIRDLIIKPLDLQGLAEAVRKVLDR